MSAMVRRPDGAVAETFSKAGFTAACSTSFQPRRAALAWIAFARTLSQLCFCGAIWQLTVLASSWFRAWLFALLIRILASFRLVP